MKKFIILIFFFESLALFSQSKNTELRLFTFAEVEKLHQKNPKPLVVFLHTKWCKFCYGMKKTTFKNSKVIQLLNDHFYFIKLDGEEKKEITFLGKTFIYKPTGINTGTHELAKELASINGKIAYPTTTILNTKFEINIQIDGYLKAKKMVNLLNEYKN